MVCPACDRDDPYLCSDHPLAGSCVCGGCGAMVGVWIDGATRVATHREGLSVRIVATGPNAVAAAEFERRMVASIRPIFPPA